MYIPDDTISAALRRIGVRDVGQLPVVARKNPRHLVGLLRNTDIARAYDLAVTRRAARYGIVFIKCTSGHLMMWIE
ncbi:MAG: CBS domain-containing protein [Candidatus Brocadiaceae bacterium]